MKLDFEYGQGLMSAELPDSTDIFIPGETVPDPLVCPKTGTACMLPPWSLSSTPSA